MKTTLRRSDFKPIKLEDFQSKYGISDSYGLDGSLSYLRNTGHTVISKNSPEHVADVLYRMRSTHSVEGDPDAYWIGQQFILVF